jgi:hypothetical protein
MVFILSIDPIAERTITLPTWAEVFRRIGLDERDHMTMSFVYCYIPEWIATYDGMPEKPGLIHSK